ncbi:hypothetical protein [Natronosalvus rutilus]|uniref:Uncharacterized protein n=1 Tax=Natronosalvus rutilus TaxID=2953753 RepID=A0A9E7SVN1_9EURY|nr:hypothetical protein [Natronosalvus rutilus]UTF56034.1 hypothetical protein NGM29_20825 [Natronosalvus rutilus]
MPTDDDDLEPSTVSGLRKQIRRLIESDVRGGYRPLRKYEKNRAYYALTGKKLENASNGRVSFEVLNLLFKEYDADFEPREAFDCGGPFTKPEISALADALEEEAGDE